MAATELKGQAILAAIDGNSYTGSRTAQEYNIRGKTIIIFFFLILILGFPVLKYFENGEYKFDFEGIRTKQGINSSFFFSLIKRYFGIYEKSSSSSSTTSS